MILPAAKIHVAWSKRLVEFFLNPVMKHVPGLVMTNSLLLNIAIETVGNFPLKVVIFHSYVNVYQKVIFLNLPMFKVPL